jgi:ParB family transcriptional regulator, chromosome partitioning protein
MNQTTLRDIPVTAIKPNPQQPRKHFDPTALRELADSIQAHGGVEQAITVTPNGGPDSYLIVDGERRWRATQLAGLTTISAIVKPKKTDLAMAESALIANLQHADLSAIEEAHAYQTLMTQGLSVGEISQRIGRAQTMIYARLTWLKLAPEIQALVDRGELQADMRVVTALLTVPESIRIELATKMAHAHATIKAIESACQKVVDQSHQTKDKATMRKLAAKRAVAQGHELPADNRQIPVAHLKQAARAMCAPCDIKQDVLGAAFPAPAWTLITHAADSTCAGCGLQNLKDACSECPGVELLRKLIALNSGGKA